ncbi:MAG: pyridoxamine 5'-phosphate oxidase family protein [Pseudomonadota bacterium]
MTDVPVSEQNRVRRVCERGHYDRATINQILDEALVAHLGYIDNGRPLVTPTVHWRSGDFVYWHGPKATRYMKASHGTPVCLTVTLLDGLVLARSAFHHSANYRSVMVHGDAELVSDRDDRYAALEAMIEKLYPGRWSTLRPMNEGEFAGTQVHRLPIEAASAKIRQGPPKDDAEDYALDIWAGVLAFDPPERRLIEDPQQKPGLERPAHINTLVEPTPERDP